MSRHDGDDEAGDVQHGEGDHLAPGERVADAAVERVRPILGEADDVGLRLHAGQPAAQPGDAGADEDGAEPERHPRVEAALEQVEGERTGRDEEHEDPDRPVIEPVIELVALADFPLGGVLDWDAQGFFFRVFGFLLLAAGERVAREPGV